MLRSLVVSSIGVYEVFSRTAECQPLDWGKGSKCPAESQPRVTVESGEKPSSVNRYWHGRLGLSMRIQKPVNIKEQVGEEVTFIGEQFQSP